MFLARDIGNIYGTSNVQDRQWFYIDNETSGAVELISIWKAYRNEIT